MTMRQAAALVLFSVVMSGCATPPFRPFPAVAPRDLVLNGVLTTFDVSGQQAWMITPPGRPAGERRWVWFAPFMPINPDAGGRAYAALLLDEGYVVAGVDVTVSCGSPAGVAVFEAFYEQMIHRHGLDPRVRFLAQSSGGLQAYAWAFRHADRVDRIAGIYPATDMRSWPGLDGLVTLPGPEMKFSLSTEELNARLPEFNPIDNLAPLAAAGVKIFHLHGDADDVVNIDANSRALRQRYRAIGGDAELEVLRGRGHSTKSFFSSQRLVEFLVAPGK